MFVSGSSIDYTRTTSTKIVDVHTAILKGNLSGVKQVDKLYSVAVVHLYGSG